MLPLSPFDLLRALPAPGELPAPVLHKLIEAQRLLERRMVYPAFRFLQALTASQPLNMLYREFFPNEWLASTKSVRRPDLGDRAEVEDGTQFSPRELEFFDLVSEHLFPLDTDAYRWHNWQLDTDDEIPLYIEFKGLDTRELDGAENHGEWILYGLANAIVSDEAWKYQLGCLGLSLDLLPEWLRNSAADPKRVIYLRYVLPAIIKDMAALDTQWHTLLPAWRYATNRTGSNFFDLTGDDFMEMGYTYPGISRERIRNVLREYLRAKPDHDAFYVLAGLINNRPDMATALIQTVTAHTKIKPLARPLTLAEIYARDDTDPLPRIWRPTGRSYPPSYITTIYTAGGPFG